MVIHALSIAILVPAFLQAAFPDDAATVAVLAPYSTIGECHRALAGKHSPVRAGTVFACASLMLANGEVRYFIHLRPAVLT